MSIDPSAGTVPSPASKRQRERLRLLGAMAPYLQQPHDKLFRTVFEHLLFGQSRVKPRAVRGALQGRITQLMMMAAYRHRREALRSAARLLATLPPEAGETTVRMFVLYLLATQDRGTARSFGEELRGAISGPGGELMTYAEELIREGREQGRQEGEQKGVLKGRVGTIENLLQAGVQWSVIESATGIDQDALRALKQRLAGSDDEERVNAK